MRKGDYVTPILIDGNNLIKRACMASALDDLKAGGVFTGGIYGTLNSLASFLNMPEVMAGPIWCFMDGGTPPFRLKLLPEYKSKRAEKRDLLPPAEQKKWLQQFVLSGEMLELLGVSCIKYKNFEADDVVAAAVRLCVEAGHVPVVVSSDKDLWQVVRMGAVVYDLANDRWVMDENFEELAGTRPETYLLYRTLVGDTSDSIQGCRGCGKGTAPKVIAELHEALGDDLYGYDPLAQLDFVRAVITEKPEKERKAYERNFLDDYGRLVNVMKGIDLSASFTDIDDLRAKMQTRLPVQMKKLLQLAVKLKFSSVMGSPQRYIRPFSEAQERCKQPVFPA